MDWNSKSKMELNWPPIQFYCLVCIEFGVGIKRWYLIQNPVWFAHGNGISPPPPLLTSAAAAHPPPPLLMHPPPLLTLPPSLLMLPPPLLTLPWRGRSGKRAAVTGERRAAVAGKRRAAVAEERRAAVEGAGRGAAVDSPAAI